MQTIAIKASCKVLGVDRHPGAVLDVPDAVAANLLAFGRASIVKPEIETRQPEIENRDPVTEPPRKARSQKSK
jgi:hypothetical protein